ncbi:hypothetical protein [Celeribacter indicus]|uniref:Uncharacterized protein n=1 Tax=Celeribacter indicus TaxID=1208324 RepID=A0A0B5E6F8_9RHOB|nr:hypothetical protein [Celeribacter indicus]AJE48591.1 hypothetical protein P73_3876 [Celeribacter indicus]SDX09237.1 hypothetical protein SAMN05443573_11384 [Celeribacter indicus]
MFPGAINQFVERLFQPIALGALLLFLAPSVAALAAHGDPDWNFGEIDINPSQTLAAVLFFFLIGQVASVLGQSAFLLLRSRLEDGVPTFVRVARLVRGYPLLERRYDDIRFKVDLLCGLAGVGIVASLTELAAALPLLPVDPAPGRIAFGLVLALLSLSAARFHTREFLTHLRALSQETP